MTKAGNTKRNTTEVVTVTPENPLEGEVSTSTPESSSDVSSEESSKALAVEDEKLTAATEPMPSAPAPSPAPAPGSSAQRVPTKAASPPVVASAPPKTAAEQRQIDFESWYMKAMTEQFADDLDKVRQAPDFKASSVPILVQAMKQGVGVFSEKERDVIMSGRQ